jgi:hypothetical protein
MKDDLKSKYLYELHSLELFTAQQALEEEQYKALQDKLLTLDPKIDVIFEYAKLRGALEALRQLKANRDRLIEIARSRINNS